MKFNKKSKITLTVLLIFFVGIYFEIERNMGKPTFYKEITKKILPQNFKDFFKTRIFSSKYEYMLLENKNKKLKKKISKQNEMIGARNMKISELISAVGVINFQKTHDELVNINEIGEMRYLKFGTSDLIVGKNPNKKASTTFFFRRYFSRLFGSSSFGGALCFAER